MRPDGIVYHPGRNQPYTIWMGGKVMGFRATEMEALERLAQAQGETYIFRRSPRLAPLGLVGVARR